MKCSNCDHEGPKASFLYLYNTRLDEDWEYRECPKCHGWVTCYASREEEYEREHADKLGWGQ